MLFSIPFAWLLLSSFKTNEEQFVDPPRLVDGEILMNALGIEPGRAVGELLEVVREAQAEGEITTPEQAVELARRALQAGVGRTDDAF